MVPLSTFVCRCQYRGRVWLSTAAGPPKSSRFRPRLAQAVAQTSSTGLNLGIFMMAVVDLTQ